MDTEPHVNHSIRIIDLPACKMATSRGHSLDEFDRWWSALDKQRNDKFYPRDFMFYDFEAQELVWLYALEDRVTGPIPFDVIDFPGGLYAAAISRDQDDVDGNRVAAEIKEWVKASGCFELDDDVKHPELFHVITSDRAFEKMKYRQLDIYEPIK